MKKNPVLLAAVMLLLSACSPVKLPVTNEYQLNAYSSKQLAKKPKSSTILITAPEAMADYQTEQMLYIDKPYKLEAFAKNAWTSPPAEMLYPLLMQSVQRSGFFHAVTTTAYADEADYRLDTQLIRLHQNFLQKPSVLEFAIKVSLTHIADNKVIGSQIISQHIPCSMNTPYGGVIAANKASQAITAAVAQFVVSRIKHD